MSFYTRDELAPTVVLLCQAVSPGGQEVGTGNLITNGSRLFLVTAEHVAKKMKSSGGFIMSGLNDQPVSIRWSQVTKFHGDSIPWVFHEEADLAVLLMNPSQDLFEQHFQKRFVPLETYHAENSPPSRDTVLTSVGFPLGLGIGELISPLTFQSRASSGFLTLRRADNDQTSTFFVLENPSIGGYSGCAIYDLSVHKLRAVTTTGDGTMGYGFMHGTVSDDTGGKLALVTPSHYLHQLIDLCLAREETLLTPPNRNADCYCGSGEKFKNCHGKV